jgi:hypothetical protein
MSERDEIRRTMDEYLEAFVSHDIARAMPHYRLPVAFIMPTGVLQPADATQLERLLQSLFATLQQKDHKASRWDELYIHLLTSKCALVSTVFSRLRSDGSLIESLGGTYQLVCEEGAWKILSLAAHATSAVIRS